MIVLRKTVSVRGKHVLVDVYEVQGYQIVIEGRFPRIARLKDEMGDDVSAPDRLIADLKRVGLKADVFTFWPRVPDSRSYAYRCEYTPQALLPITTYEHWWMHQISKKTRNRINKAAKLGVEIRIVPFSDELVRSIKKIFDETPVKRNKPFWHYAKSEAMLKEELGRDLEHCEFIGAFFQGELIGFVKMLYRDRFGDPVLFISSMEESDKSPNNALLAKQVERCAAKGLPYIHYNEWRMGTHGDFLRRNGFEKIDVPRYYAPLSLRGALCLRVGAHLRLWDVLPETVKLPITRWRGRWHELRTEWRSSTES